MPADPIAMTLILDTEADAGYITAVTGASGQPVARSVPVRDKDDSLYATFDLAADGTLLGIEILGVSKLLTGNDA
jgi:hypothetical protein